jgi:hypothetical protein
MNDSDNKKIVLVGVTLYTIETGPGNENRYEIHFGIGGDYLVNTHDFSWNLFHAFLYGIPSLLILGAFFLFLLDLFHSVV